jgi:hypothetical protein
MCFWHLMKTRTFFIFAITFSVLPALNGRITQAWTYQEMFDKADLVAIAEVVSTKDTEERNALQDIEPHVAVIGVLTDFRSLLLLKGPRNLATFQLHHYRFQSDDEKFAASSPALVETSAHEVFLLFLVKGPHGRYAPVTGQTDPALFSVLELHGSAF